MDISNYTRKDIGNLGEKVAIEYLRRKDFSLIERNVARKTGELDIIMRKGEVMHFVEVKTVLCKEFLSENSLRDEYSPAENLHAYKIRKVVRTAEWYVAECGWEGEWQVDAVLVRMRFRDGICRVEYLPQIV